MLSIGMATWPSRRAAAGRAVARPGPIDHQDLLAKLRAFATTRVTVLLVEQAVGHALPVVDHVYVLRNGRVVADMTGDEARRRRRTGPMSSDQGGATRMNIIRPQDDAAVERSATGGKGSSLARLVRAGFDARPPFFVVSIDAFRSRDGSSLTGEVLAELRTAYDEIGGESVQVAARSSAASEDAEGGSSAGLYETYLTIESFDELVRGIEKCWRSLDNDNGAAVPVRPPPGCRRRGRGRGRAAAHRGRLVRRHLHHEPGEPVPVRDGRQRRARSR